MISPLTAQQAIELLVRNPAAYNSRENLGNLAALVEANSPGSVTVLFSGRVGPDISAEEVAKGLAISRNDVRIINNSDAAKRLTSRYFLSALAR